MEILTSAGTTYPRLGKNSVGHKLRWLFHKADKNKASESEIIWLQDQLIREIILEQEQAGIDIVIDGQIRRSCPISFFASSLEGVEIGSLHHYFDTNFHVRKVIVKKLPRWTRPITVSEFSYADSLTESMVKIVLPSVSLLMRYSENQSSCGKKEIENAYERAIQQEVSELRKAGCKFIYLDDYEGKYAEDYNVLRVVDGRSKIMENPQQVVKSIKGRLKKGINILEPSWGLEVLPRRYAKHKLEILTAIKESLI